MSAERQSDPRVDAASLLGEALGRIADAIFILEDARPDYGVDISRALAVLKQGKA